MRTQPVSPTVATWAARHPALTVAAALLFVVVALLVGWAVGLPTGWWGGLLT